MNAPTFEQFVEALLGAGWRSPHDAQWDGAERLYAQWFASPALPAGQTITLGERDEEPTMLDLFGEPMSPDEATQKPMGSDDYIADLISDAQAHDRDHGLLPNEALPNGCGEQTR